MLKEFRQVRQVTGCIRRWFNDDFFDLIVWYDKNQRVTGFQLCYDKGGNEHAMTWRQEKGFSHQRVDDGEGRPGRKMAPILVPNGVFEWQAVMDRFAAESTELDSALRDLVLEKLGEYGTGLT